MEKCLNTGNLLIVGVKNGVKKVKVFYLGKFRVQKGVDMFGIESIGESGHII